MASVVVSFLISAGGSLAQAVLDLFSQPPCNENFNEQIIRCNPEDNVFEEFDSSEGTWKEKRGSLWRAVVRSLWISLQMAFLSAFCVGFGAICLATMYIVIYSKCGPSMKIHATYNIVQVFFVYFWHPLLLLNIFRAQFLREANVFTISLVGALLDIVIRLFLALFDVYEHLWKTIIGCTLFTVIILVNSFNIGRKLFPQNKKQAAKVAFKLGAQFIFGPLAFFLVLYVITPTFVNHPGTVQRLVLLGLAMLTTFPMKVISRFCALNLEGINHPGNSFILVSVAYGSSIILFRIMQAEAESFATFIALSLVHGVFQLVEVLMIEVEAYFVRKIRQCCGDRLNPSVDEENYAEPDNEASQQKEKYRKRAHCSMQRFLADTFIQGMLFEMTALLISVSMMELYGIINVASIEVTISMAEELVKRIYAGVLIEFGFNFCCVLILTRYMNIPILRVWKVRWKSHVTVFIIITVISLLHYAENMVHFVKMGLLAEEIMDADASCIT